jgi:Flp pilus assembly protein TadG
MDMNKHRGGPDRAGEEGVALIYMAVTLTTLLLATGLAVDAGRAYVVKAQLTKAVDGAALAAARHLNSGNPRGEAEQIFKANFPAGYMGTSSVTDPTTAGDFYKLVTDNVTMVNRITITASTVLPTTFMKLGDFHEVTVGASGEATRRMVDLSLVLDVSSSIGWRWPYVRDAARTFVDAFDPAHDRMALITYGTGSSVLDAMPASRGFDKASVKAHIPNGLPGGSTAMAEGLYRGWDELRTVPAGQQSSLRIIVLFTDGASNSVPGNHDGTGIAKGLRTADFPKNAPDPDGQTWARPDINGLYDTQSGNGVPGHPAFKPTNWDSPVAYAAVPLLALSSMHTHHRSGGIPTNFPLQTGALTVNGAAQSARRPLRNMDAVTKRYPSDVWNINNASRNLLEIIANAARADTGDYRVRIYTLGMGELVTYMLGTMPEMPQDILKRVANDKESPDFNNAQLEGMYFYAETPDDVGPAFQGIQNQIIRLTK